MTGVNPVTLRAWERRYGLVKPDRTPKGHRVYTRKHIEKIEQILDRLSAGMTISQIARNFDNIEAASASVESESAWHEYLRRMIAAIAAFDEHGLESAYNEAMSLYPVDVVTTRLILPLLEMLGTRWETMEGTVGEEHFFSVYLRNKLGARFHHQNLTNRGPRLIMSCLPGERHEFGILLFALMAHSKGYRIVMLGADLPIHDLVDVAARTDSEAIVLAGSSTIVCSELTNSIHALTSRVDIPVFIGGEFAVRCKQEIDRAKAIPLTSDFTASLFTIAGSLGH
jgi:DNA-binding transcriptional MerR regulator/methylmalonyl-CoA mutase cobalamin-binding subunit